jgi:hypothetical protein
MRKRFRLEALVILPLTISIDLIKCKNCLTYCIVLFTLCMLFFTYYQKIIGVYYETN